MKQPSRHALASHLGHADAMIFVDRYRHVYDPKWSLSAMVGDILLDVTARLSHLGFTFAFAARAIEPLMSLTAEVTLF